MEILKKKSKIAPEKSGIYIMLSKNSEPLYIGKAINLKNRIKQYINPTNLRIQKMISQIADVRFIVTKTNEEALILEMSNIKSMKPKYNILLKDNKTFPEILITNDEFPRILKHRGKREKNGTYFGPFASSENVNQAIDIARQFFKLRTCSNQDFLNRTRPCLEYQIKRCTAPCMKLIENQDYKQYVTQAIHFLRGKVNDTHKELSNQMQKHSDSMEFEKALQIRNIITSISAIQISDNIQIFPEDHMDILGYAINGNQCCIHIFFIRNGYNCGNVPYFFEFDDNLQEILYNFIYQFYSRNEPPANIYVNHIIEYSNELSRILKTKITNQFDKRIERIIEFANQNAQNSLSIKLSSLQVTDEIVLQIQKLFNLPKIPNKIEVFDNSHTAGTNAIGAMIAVNREGFDKKSYKRYNFQTLLKNNSDDYGMMREMLMRRLAKIKESYESGNIDKIPDLWLIDGGVGHVSIVESVMNSIGFEIPFICISKGEKRNSGMEEFHTKYEKNIQIDRKSQAMFFLQRIRDEAHRFAISNHKSKRDKDSIKSALDEISGIGSKRKQALLKHFGSVRLIKDASVSDLMQVDGISKKMAEIIKQTLQKN